MKVLLMLSGKGGTGKTTTAAAFIRFAGAKAAADCDVDAPNLHLIRLYGRDATVTDFMGGDKAQVDASRCTGCGACEAHCRFGAIRMAKGVCHVNDLACEGCGVCAQVCGAQAVTLLRDRAGEKRLYSADGVFSTAQLRMGRGNSGKLVSEVKGALYAEAKDVPLAIVDGSPGIGCPVMASMSGVDLALIVAEPSSSGLSDLVRLMRMAKPLGTALAVCVNKWDVDPLYTRRIEDYCRENDVPFVGKIPYDPSASLAINRGESLADGCGPAREALWMVYTETMKLLGLSKEEL